jgi:hypothetical protein
MLRSLLSLVAPRMAAREITYTLWLDTSYGQMEVIVLGMAASPEDPTYSYLAECSRSKSAAAPTMAAGQRRDNGRWELVD